MPEADPLEVPIEVKDREFHRKFDEIERRFKRAGETARSEGGKGVGSAAFLGSFAGTAAGFVAGSVMSSGPVGTIADAFLNTIIAALLPVLVEFVPLLQQLGKFLNSPGVQKLIEYAAEGTKTVSKGLEMFFSEDAQNFFRSPYEENPGKLGPFQDIGDWFKEHGDYSLSGELAKDRGKKMGAGMGMRDEYPWIDFAAQDASQQLAAARTPGVWNIGMGPPNRDLLYGPDIHGGSG